jgi:hypothetical protein
MLYYEYHRLVCIYTARTLFCSEKLSGERKVQKKPKIIIKTKTKTNQQTNKQKSRKIKI